MSCGSKRLTPLAVHFGSKNLERNVWVLLPHYALSKTIKNLPLAPLDLNSSSDTDRGKVQP